MIFINHKNKFIFFIALINFSASKSTSQSATLAHLTALGNSDYMKNQKVINAYGLDNIKKYKKIIDKMIENEKEYSDTHYVFYHTLNNEKLVMQDLQKQLYMLSNKINPKKLSKFTAFRVPGHPNYNKFKSKNEFLDWAINLPVEKWKNPKTKNTETYYLICDRLGITSKYIISVNLALFANTNLKSESSFYYLIKNTGAKTKLSGEKIIKRMLNYFNVDSGPHIMNKINKIVKMIPDEGAMVQIFIPKNEVHKYLYLARNYGKPYGSPETLGVFFDRKNKKQRLPNFWKLLQTNPKAALGSSRAYRIENILPRYLQDPSKIPNFNNLQARIIISNDLILNPNKVIMYRYSGYETGNSKYKKIYKKYQKRMEELTKKLVTKWKIKKL